METHGFQKSSNNAKKFLCMHEVVIECYFALHIDMETHFLHFHHVT